MIFNHP